MLNYDDGAYAYNGSMGLAADDGSVCELSEAFNAQAYYHLGVGPSITSTEIGQTDQDAGPSHHLEFTSIISNVVPDSAQRKLRYQYISCPTHRRLFSFDVKPLPPYTLQWTKLVCYSLDILVSRS